MLIALLFALTLDDPAADAVAATPPTAVSVPAPDSARPAPPVTSAKPAPAPRPAEPSSAAADSRFALPPPATAPVSPDLHAVWRDHPSLRVPDIFRIDFTAKFQLDTRDPGDEPDDFDTVEVHRMRLGIEGELFKHIEYQVEREFSERETNDPEKKSTKTPWKDVWIEANYTSAAQVRAGKFKIPFSLDELSGEAELDFVYRSLGATYLAPGRDIGAEVHGRLFHRKLNYWGGVFKGDGDNASTSKIEGADTTVAARLTVSPFEQRSALEFGGSWTESDLANESFYPNGLRGRTAMSQFVFFEPVYVDGHRRRLGADAEWTHGPLAARSEYIFVADTRHGQGLGDEDLVDARARAWYALGTWVITGEGKRRPVQPRHGGLFRGGFGAVEVAARYDRLWFDSEDGGEPPARNTRAVTIYPNGDRVWTLGLNYYVNRWMKLQLNAINEGTDDLERSPTPDGSRFWSKVLRLQLEL